MLNLMAETTIHRGLYGKDTSSASYKAHREEDGRFTLCRMPHKKYDTVPLIAVADQDMAQRLLDWFVSHDRLVLRILDSDVEGSLFAVLMEAVNDCTN